MTYLDQAIFHKAQAKQVAASFGTADLAYRGHVVMYRKALTIAWADKLLTMLSWASGIYCVVHVLIHKGT